MIRIKIIDKNGKETQFMPKSEEEAHNLEQLAIANGCTAIRMGNVK